MLYVVLRSAEPLFALAHLELSNAQKAEDSSEDQIKEEYEQNADNKQIVNIEAVSVIDEPQRAESATPAPYSLSAHRASLQARSRQEALNRYIHPADPFTLDQANLDAAGSPSAKPVFSFKLKIVIGFFQIVANLALSIDVQWPSQFMQFTSWLSPVNFDFVSVSNIG